jgi:hypothetical protein
MKQETSANGSREGYGENAFEVERAKYQVSFKNQSTPLMTVRPNGNSPTANYFSIENTYNYRYCYKC